MKQFLLFTSIMLVNNVMCMQNCSTFGPNTSYINRTVFVGGLLVDSAMHPDVCNNLFLKHIANPNIAPIEYIKPNLVLLKHKEKPMREQDCKTPINTSKNATKIQRGEQYQHQRDFNLAQNVQHESYLKSNQEAAQQENQEQRLCRSFLNNTDALCSQNSTPVSPQSYETSQILLNTQDLLVSSQGRNQEYNVINFQDKQAESQQSHTKQYRPAHETLKALEKPEAQKQEQSVQVDNTKQLEQQIQRLQECVENLKLKHKKQDNEQKIQRLEERETYYLEIIKKLTGYGMYYQDTIKQLTETKSELLQHNNELRKESLQYKNVINAYLVKHNKKRNELHALIQRNDELLTGICQLKETNQHTNITLYNTKQDKNRLLRQTKDQEQQIQQLQDEQVILVTTKNEEISKLQQCIERIKIEHKEHIQQTEKEKELQIQELISDKDKEIQKVIQEKDLQICGIVELQKQTEESNKINQQEIERLLKENFELKNKLKRYEVTDTPSISFSTKASETKMDTSPTILMK